MNLGPRLDQQHCRFGSAGLCALKIVFLDAACILPHPPLPPTHNQHPHPSRNPHPLDHKLIEILILVHCPPPHISSRIIFTFGSTLHLHQGRDPPLVLGIDPAPLADQGLDHRGRLVLGGLIISIISVVRSQNF